MASNNRGIASGIANCGIATGNTINLLYPCTSHPRTCVFHHSIEQQSVCLWAGPSTHNQSNPDMSRCTSQSPRAWQASVNYHTLGDAVSETRWNLLSGILMSHTFVRRAWLHWLVSAWRPGGNKQECPAQHYHHLASPCNHARSKVIFESINVPPCVQWQLCHGDPSLCAHSLLDVQTKMMAELSQLNWLVQSSNIPYITATFAWVCDDTFNLWKIDPFSMDWRFKPEIKDCRCIHQNPPSRTLAVWTSLAGGMHFAPPRAGHCQNGPECTCQAWACCWGRAWRLHTCNKET